MSKKVLLLSFAAGLAGAAALLAATAYLPGLPKASVPDVVTFDATRLANAQRAIAAGLLDNQSDALITLARIGRETEATIQTVAGGRLVLVKQAVVAGTVPDITDEVLQRLGLPTDVPTVDPMQYLQELAPTELTHSMSRLVVEDRAKQAAKNHEERVQRKQDEQLKELLP